MARLPISEIVQGWCNDHNAMTGANRWFLALWSGLLGCIGVLWITSSFWLVVAAVAVALLWLEFAPKPIQYGQLRTTHRGVFVEDSLLVRLADAQEVPEWVKSAIAHELEARHHITFEALFDIEGWIETEAAHARVERRPGFQKIVAFSQKGSGRT